MSGQFAPFPGLPSRILVVDDDPFVGTVVAGILKAAGVDEVKVCVTGEEAVAVAASFQPGLILLDFLMPGMDGGATWRALDAVLTPLPPVIFLTARDDADFEVDIAPFNPAGILAKPFEPAALEGDICRILQRPTGERRAPHTPAAKARRLAAVAEAFQRSLPVTAARITESSTTLHEKGWVQEAAHVILADAHSLAGSAGLFGFAALGAAAHDAERAFLNALKAERAPTAVETRGLANTVKALIAACREAGAT